MNKHRIRGPTFFKPCIFPVIHLESMNEFVFHIFKCQEKCREMIITQVGFNPKIFAIFDIFELNNLRHINCECVFKSSTSARYKFTCQNRIMCFCLF